MEAESLLDLLKQVIANGKISPYYFSDLTGLTTALHRSEVPYLGKPNPVDLPYRWHAEEPSEDLTSAVWGDDSHSWIENNDKSQPALIAKLQAGNAAMQKKMEDYEAAKIKDAQSNDKVVQVLSDVQKGQAQTTAVLTQLVLAVQQLSKSANISDKPNAADETKKKEGTE